MYLPGTAAGLQANGDPSNGGRRTHVAAFKAAVRQVDPVRHTADLLYELPPEADKSGLFAKDQMVAVLLPLGGEEEETVVPYSAVVFDAYAGSWIYLDRTADSKGPHVYERRRVELGAAVGDGVVIRPALRAQDRVVVDGAAKLFSAEFFKPPMKTK